jgi:hypothetical protein
VQVLAREATSSNIWAATGERMVEDAFGQFWWQQAKICLRCESLECNHVVDCWMLVGRIVVMNRASLETRVATRPKQGTTGAAEVSPHC